MNSVGTERLRFIGHWQNCRPPRGICNAIFLFSLSIVNRNIVYCVNYIIWRRSGSRRKIGLKKLVVYQILYEMKWVKRKQVLYDTGCEDLSPTMLYYGFPCSESKK